MTARRSTFPLMCLFVVSAACGDDGTATDSGIATVGSTSSTGSTTADDSSTGPGDSSTSAATETTTSSSSGSSTGSDTDPTATTEATVSTSDDATAGTTLGTGDTTLETGDTTLETGDTTLGTGDTTFGTGTSIGGEESTAGDETTGGSTDNAAFVGMSTNDDYVVFDSLAQTVVSSSVSLLPDANYPYDVTLMPDGTEAWFVGASGDGVVAVDATTGAIITQWLLSVPNPYPVDVLFSADGATAYVASRDDASLTLIDSLSYTELTTSPTPGGNDAGKMALNPCTGQIYVVEWFGDNLMTYDPATDLWQTVDIGSASLWDLVVHPSGSPVYVTDRSNDVVHVFDVSTTGGLPTAIPDASIPVGDDPWGIDITPDGSTLVVACEDDSSVHFVDTATLVPTSLTLPLDADPRDVDISVDGALAFVPSGNIAGDDAVYVLDIASAALANTIPIVGSSNPNVVAVAPQAVTCSN